MTTQWRRLRLKSKHGCYIARVCDRARVRNVPESNYNCLNQAFFYEVLLLWAGH